MQKLSSVQKITVITVITDKKIINPVSIFVVLCSTSVSVSNQIVSLVWFYFLLESAKEEEKKITRKIIKCKLDCSSKMYSSLGITLLAGRGWAMRESICYLPRYNAIQPEKGFVIYSKTILKEKSLKAE